MINVSKGWNEKQKNLNVLLVNQKTFVKGIKLLLVMAFGLMLNVCYDKYEQKMIIVNKIPRGAYAGEEIPHNIGWDEIGLSRSGKEPIEYIWRTGKDYDSYIIISSEIGERGTIRLTERAKREEMKLPRPSKKEPPIIGMFREVYWEKHK
jgi:hypothetical protein